MPNELPLQMISSSSKFLAEHGVSELLSESVTGVIALDEVGRGCLAGPVVACASFWLFDLTSSGCLPSTFPFNKVRDSKKVSEKARTALFETAAESLPHLLAWSPASCEKSDLQWSPGCFVKARNKPILLRSFLPQTTHLHVNSTLNLCRVPKFNMNCIGVQVGAASPWEIDKFNIWNATQLAMGRALIQLLNDESSAGAFQKIGKLVSPNFVIIVDGKLGIRVPKEFQNFPQITAVQGDDIFVSVGFSSIIAKVLRDRYMKSQADDYPKYGFDAHKGYGTQKHRNAIEIWQTTPLHRRSFLNNILKNSGAALPTAKK